MRMSLPREMNAPFQGGGPVVLEIKINVCVLAIFSVSWSSPKVIRITKSLEIDSRIKSEPKWALSALSKWHHHTFLWQVAAGSTKLHFKLCFDYLWTVWWLITGDFHQGSSGSWEPWSTEKWPPPPQSLLITAFSSCVSKSPRLHCSYCLLPAQESPPI